MFCQGFYLFKAVHKSLEVFPNNAQENPGGYFFPKLLSEDEWHFKFYFIALVLSADVTACSLLAHGHAKTTLRDHVFKTVTVYDVTECGLLCSRDLRLLICAIIRTKYSVS